VRDAFSQLLTAETIVQEFTDKSQGIVNLSISLHYIPQKINDMIARFNQKFPNTKFNIKMRTFDDGIIALGKHEADISIFAYSKPLDIDESKFITKNLSTITIIEGDKTQKFNLAILFGCNLTSKFATAFIDFICPRP
jgi:DNA-binding transcriptional LysR family regulator